MSWELKSNSVAFECVLGTRFAVNVRKKGGNQWIRTVLYVCVCKTQTSGRELIYRIWHIHCEAFSSQIHIHMMPI